MSDQQPPAFQSSIEAMESYASGREIPPPVNPLQAQTAFEHRARVEDYVAHFIGIVMTSGFFMLAFAVLLGFVNISNAATATMVGTILGYAIGKIDPVLTRYFTSRSAPARREAAPAEETAPPSS